MTPHGEVLVGGALLQRQVRVQTGNATTFTWAVPSDMALCGLDLHVQGACLVPSEFSTPKLMRARSRFSNALDPTLGL